MRGIESGLSAWWRCSGMCTAGNWYRMPESELQWSAKFSRPAVLACDCESGATAQVYPRTTQSSREAGSVAHRAHPRDHAERCVVDLDGTIVMARRKPVSADYLTPANYSCFEPFEDILQAIQGEQ